MAVTLHVHENPAPNPTPAPDGLSVTAAALDPAPIWGRIEAWCSYRWALRVTLTTIEGEAGDEWVTPIAPFALDSALIWKGAWVDATIWDTGLGLALPISGRFKLIGTYGEDEAPDATVNEAYRRLAEYIADAEHHRFAGASSVKVDAGQVGIQYDRAPTHMARAIALSGAADLLRPYRYQAPVV